MRAQILSIGSELLVGDITDTNATYLAQELAALGIELLRVTQVGDDRKRIVAVLREATAEAELIICTGGIGPTEDDLTREAIADLAGQQPDVDPTLLQRLKEHFAARGQAMPERNAKQAWTIPAVEILPNPIGSAPGWLATIGNVRVIAMPGVPREMKRMWREQALPRLEASPDRYVRSTTLKTIGIGESSAEELISDLVAHDNPIVATYAKDDGVHVRITAIERTEQEANQLRDKTVALVRKRLAGHIYASDEVTLPEVILAGLRQRGLRIGIVDHASGGQFAALLASSPDAAQSILGSLVIGMGQASEQSAVHLAEQARQEFGAELGLGIVGEMVEAGDAVYRGTVRIALSGTLTAETTVSVRGGWQDNQRRAALAAAGLLWQTLGDHGD